MLRAASEATIAQLLYGMYLIWISLMTTKTFVSVTIAGFLRGHSTKEMQTTYCLLHGYMNDFRCTLA